MMEWIAQHRVSLLWAGGASALFIVAMMVIAPIVIVRLPADYLRQGQGGRKSSADHHGAGRRIARNILGWLLIVGGVVMLALPGPGVLVILIGVVLADFPGK